MSFYAGSTPFKKPAMITRNRLEFDRFSQFPPPENGKINGGNNFVQCYLRTKPLLQRTILNKAFVQFNFKKSILITENCISSHFR